GADDRDRSHHARLRWIARRRRSQIDAEGMSWPRHGARPAAPPLMRKAERGPPGRLLPGARPADPAARRGGAGIGGVRAGARGRARRLPRSGGRPAAHAARGGARVERGRRVEVLVEGVVDPAVALEREVLEREAAVEALAPRARDEAVGAAERDALAHEPVGEV